MEQEKRRYTIRLLPDRSLPRELQDYVARESAAWADHLRVTGRRQRARARLLMQKNGQPGHDD